MGCPPPPDNSTPPLIIQPPPLIIQPPPLIIQPLDVCVAGIFLYILDSGAGGELNKTAWARNRAEREKKAREELEAEKKKTGEAMKACEADSYASHITPSTAFHIRNRYLSRVGTKVRILFSQQFFTQFKILSYF